MYFSQLATMAILSKASRLVVRVVDVFYCGVVGKATNANGEPFNFSLEKFRQNPNQGTKPVDDAPATEPWPDRSNVEMDKALDYWLAHIEKNADGTRKGGAFAKANFSLNGIPIGAEFEVEILENTAFNTEVLVHYGGAAPFKAYACAKPSPQYAVDTYIICLFQGELYIRLIKRADAGPDYPSARAIIGGFLNGDLSVDQGRDAELNEEGGIVLGDNRIREINLPERTDEWRDPRYTPSSYLNSAGEIVTFGCKRGSTANAVVHFVSPKDTTQLPRLAEATDKAEVVTGEWIPVADFLAMSNDPAAGVYVAWLDHQAGARDAVEKLRELKLV